MLKCLLALLLLSNLTACGSIANFYDRTDPCQTGEHLGRPKNYEPPNYCGAGAGKAYIYTNTGARVGYIK
jgi:hypothetical protein